jgi:hypothetical protein
MGCLARARSYEQDQEAQQNEAENIGSQIESSRSGAGLLIEPQTGGGSDSSDRRLFETARAAHAAQSFVFLLCALSNVFFMHDFPFKFLADE